MIAANGFLRDRNNAEICHPVLTHRVRIDYDPDANTVFVRDAEIPSDLYSVVFGSQRHDSPGGSEPGL